MASLAVHTRDEVGRSAPTADPGIQTCLTFALDFRVDLYPNVASVKEENEAGEAKCVEEGSLQPARG